MRLVLEVAECCKADIDHVASSSNNGGDRWPAQRGGMRKKPLSGVGRVSVPFGQDLLHSG